MLDGIIMILDTWQHFNQSHHLVISPGVVVVVVLVIIPRVVLPRVVVLVIVGALRQREKIGRVQPVVSK